MKSKEEIIHDMCMTYRHDYGLTKNENDTLWVAGMTDTEREGLYRTMEQIYNNNVLPLINDAKDLYEGKTVVIPKNEDHATVLVKVGMFYLEQNKKA